MRRGSRRLLLSALVLGVLVWSWPRPQYDERTGPGTDRGDDPVQPLILDPGLRKVPCYVFDEHQQALPLWFAEADRRQFPPVTVVHVDAHSDLGTPPEVDEAAFVRPFGRKHTLSANDDFIHKAMHAGIVARLLWVIPDWAEHNERNIWPYVWNDGAIDDTEFSLRMGYVKDTDTPCQCGDKMSLETGDMIFTECEIAEDTDDEVDSEECMMVASVPFQVLTKRKTADVPVSFADYDQDDVVHPNLSPTPIILDIDEDFFSTEDVVQRLIDGGWDNDTLSMVDVALSDFCVGNEHEEAALADILARVVRGDPGVAPPSAFNPICDDAPRSITWETAVVALAAAVRHSMSLTRMQDKAQHMPEALLDVGLCADPGHVDWPVTMRICTGVSNPRADRLTPRVKYITNDLIVFNTPSPAQLERDLIWLRDWLRSSGIYRDVALVTICRSIRDGYLPRRLHRSVEEGILRVLREVIPNLSVASEGARDHW
eukprot:m.55133 g.55133  ORF g.55133 m.55133 type:complete len:486 (-) comp6906_c0_seq1:105-1562(-)